MGHFQAQNQHFKTFLQVCRLDFLEILTNETHWNVDETDFFGILRKILIIPKMVGMDHFGPKTNTC